MPISIEFGERLNWCTTVPNTAIVITFRNYSDNLGRSQILATLKAKVNTVIVLD